MSQYMTDLREMKREYWTKLLLEHKGNVSEVARLKGVARTRLHNDLLTLGLTGDLGTIRALRAL